MQNIIWPKIRLTVRITGVHILGIYYEDYCVQEFVDYGYSCLFQVFVCSVFYIILHKDMKDKIRIVLIWGCIVGLSVAPKLLT